MVAEEGTYTVNANGTVTFDPLPIFVGVASPVTYMVGDTLGRYVNATITPTILGCSASSSCVVGDVGPGGGKVFYVSPTNFASPGSACGSACRYLEAAPIGWYPSVSAGQTDCRFPGTSSADPRCRWSVNAFASIGSIGTAIGAGYANTSTMIAQSSVAGTAGIMARAFRGGGKTDWFLPSEDEISEMLTQQLIIDGLSNGHYWSSSEISDGLAWAEYFGLGSVGNSGFKSNEVYVRPVRAF